MSIKKVLKHDKDRTLIFLDIDNTILFSKDITYGSVEWCSNMIKTHGFIIGISKWQYALLNDKVKMIPVEDDITTSTLKKIKHADFIFCTKRSKFLKEKTVDHLNIRKDPPLKLQKVINYSHVNFNKEITDVNHKTLSNSKILKFGLFYMGILFCDFEEKEDCINEIIEKTKSKYDTYVVVDDLPLNTDKLKSDVHFLHYKKAYERKVKEFVNTKIDQVIIFISGKMGSGKDLVASYIKEIYKEEKDVTLIAIADKLKEITSSLTGTRLEDSYNNKSLIPLKIHEIDHTNVILNFLKKETNYFKFSDEDSKKEIYLKINEIIKIFLESKGSSLGKYLQILGIQFRDKFGKDFWLKLCFKRITKNGTYLITDGRFKNEADFFKSKESVMIRIEREKKLRKPSFGNRNPNHITETDLNDYLFQFKIYNNWTGKEGKMKLFEELKYLFKIKD